MGCRGVHFAISTDVANQLLAAQDDEAIMSIVEEVEEAWDKPNVAECDKAWDAIHRTLTGKTGTCKISFSQEGERLIFKSQKRRNEPGFIHPIPNEGKTVPSFPRSSIIRITGCRSARLFGDVLR